MLYENKKIFVPKIDGNDMFMTKYNQENLIKNKYGILEPAKCIPVTPTKNDIIIIPALACDLNFNRIGYGKGYYDKFLVKNKGIKILPIPSDLVSKDIPHDTNDVPVDIIITENSILKRV